MSVGFYNKISVIIYSQINFKEISMSNKKHSGFTGSHLKWIAILTMLIDHIGAVLLEYGLLPQVADSVLAGNSLEYLVPEYHFWFYLTLILRSIGRLAFPLFCFLLVEGFLHTKNIKNYAIRLGVFALISEIPFDLAVYDRIFDFQSQNVFFTLFIGLLVLYGLNYFEKTLPASMAPLRYLVVVTGVFAAQFLQTDYAGYGVLLITLIYELRNRRKMLCIFGAIYTLLLESFTAPLSFLLIYFYNGTRGKQLPKYFFYAFYPVHLLLLFLLRMCIL